MNKLIIKNHSNSISDLLIKLISSD